jgi:hypothetical protein
MMRRRACGRRARAAWEEREVTGENRDGELRGPNPGDSVPQDAEPVLVPGRSCGTCSLCCKVYSIKEINKPAGRWCAHRVRGLGCAIHPARPPSCRDFFCSWLVDPHLGPEWKPEVCRFVLSSDAVHRAIMVTVDPGRPLAWKREPYYAVLKQFSQVFFRIDQKVLVNLNGHITVILPDREVPIGPIGPGDEIVIRRDGLTYGASLRRRPELAKTPSGDLRPGSI